MNKFIVKEWIVMTALLFIAINSYSNEYSTTQRISLEWKPEWATIGSDSVIRSSLYFEDAFFSDNLPQIPLFVYRIPATPSYDYELSLKEIQTTNLTEEEEVILDNQSFNENEFKIWSEKEISRGREYLKIFVLPLRITGGNYERLISFDIKYNTSFNSQLKTDETIEYPANSVLSEGNWFKICTDKEGIYELSFNDLESLGLPVENIDISTVKIYGGKAGMLPESNGAKAYTDLQEIAVWTSNNSGNFGENDHILFYGESQDQWIWDTENQFFNKELHQYATENCYFLTYGGEPGRRIQSAPDISGQADIVFNTFHERKHHEKEVSNILGSGKLWVGEPLEMNRERTFSFSFPNISDERPARVSANVVARSTAQSTFTLSTTSASSSFNVSSINPYSYTGTYARMGQTTLSIPQPTEQLEINLGYISSASGSTAWLDYITVNATRELVFQENQMAFRNTTGIQSGKVANYQITSTADNAMIWDVTNFREVKNQNFSVDGTSISFNTDHSSLKEFIIFDNESYLSPDLTGKVVNQNLHALDIHDLIILVPEEFKSEAERLAEVRKTHDGLSVVIVTPNQVYNEFSSGTPDISAIRNFIKMFYDRGLKSGYLPTYLLLFGNGSYDNRDLLGFGGNYIPTFQTRESLNYSSSYITDDFFGLLDEDEGSNASGAIDIGIGRLPVRTRDEAQFIVDKLLRYDQRVDGLVPGTDDPRFAGVISNYADWRNQITLVGDDQDNNLHFNQSEEIADIITEQYPVFNLEKIYLDAFEQQTLAGGSRYPQVNESINNRVNKGALLINYIGHGGTNGLGHERILTFNDILSWSNFYNLPVFMTATCEFSAFDQPDPNELSAGVRVFLKPDGGASALFTTTRLAYSGSNASLNRAFIRNAFQPMENGKMPRLGDLIRISKVESSSATSLKNFVLLGDPSMQMAYPQYNAVTTAAPDTIKALERVTVTGEIQDNNGNKMTDFNGVIFPTLYDKKATMRTLANDSDSREAEFMIQDRILFRGNATVNNGEFEFSFIVPRDIMYTNGKGKISYYFDNGVSADGNGYYDNLIITGTSDEAPDDNDGPEITIFMDNEDFVSGDKTGPSPLLIVHLEDKSGINTTGQIGHDIVAFLNNDTGNPYILNDFYQTRTNRFDKGMVIFPFHNLEKGTYTLDLRAWDVLNNVSTQSVEFIVGEAPGLQISRLINSPNPFSDFTAFSFEHNKPATEMQVTVEIFNLNGKLIKTLESNVYASGFNIPDIEWDGRDEGGNLLGNGIYIFRVLVKTENNDEIQKTEKLIILR